MLVRLNLMRRGFTNSDVAQDAAQSYVRSQLYGKRLEAITLKSVRISYFMNSLAFIRVMPTEDHLNWMQHPLTSLDVSSVLTNYRPADWL